MPEVGREIVFLKVESRLMGRLGSGSTLASSYPLLILRLLGCLPATQSTMLRRACLCVRVPLLHLKSECPHLFAVPWTSEGKQPHTVQLNRSLLARDVCICQLGTTSSSRWLLHCNNFMFSRRKSGAGLNGSSREYMLLTCVVTVL